MIRIPFVVVAFCGGPAGHELSDVPIVQGCTDQVHAHATFESVRGACKASFDQTVSAINDPANELEWTDDQAYFACVLELPRALVAVSAADVWTATAVEYQLNEWSDEDLLDMMRACEGGRHGLFGAQEVTREDVAEEVLQLFEAGGGEG